MADNRLMLYCPETGASVVIGVAHGFEIRGPLEDGSITAFLKGCLDADMQMRQIELRQENAEGNCAFPGVPEMTL